MITILSGGTGTPKLIQGIKRIHDQKKIKVVVNTLENDYFSGVYIAADIDTVMYTFADMINDETWYGIKNDTFITNEELNRLNSPELLRIGDKDRAIKIQKTQLLKTHSLTEVVDIQRKSLNIKAKIIPMSDEKSQIKIVTDIGELKFHQFLIKEKSEPKVEDVVFDNVKPSKEVIPSIEKSDMVVIGPSNPITSILPIISMKDVKKALEKAYVVAISPIIGNNPVSGPTGKFMKALGYEVSPYGVASMYSNFLNKFIIDKEDVELKMKIERIVKDVEIANTKMTSMNIKEELARLVLNT
ncbi:MAG: 2-phospho-L-lactate transferase [Methanobrevibacter sp.]|jgi:LPPG:FO 2-phospho-L-lactate transferase|nr:2-phospho-L-lactate transferase [Candidatus Methanovirga aequatorialis]